MIANVKTSSISRKLNQRENLKYFSTKFLRRLKCFEFLSWERDLFYDDVIIFFFCRQKTTSTLIHKDIFG